MERSRDPANNAAAAHPNRTISSKYTALNFLPLNLYHQLSKYSTLFFFVTLILLCIPVISPFAPWPYMIAFLIVVGISMAKDGVEDYRRHVSDRAVNKAECCILRDRRRAFVAVEDLSKGDLLCAPKHGEIPADVVLLRSAVHGRCATHCFIDTSNLDGESNLKKRVSPLAACRCAKKPGRQTGRRGAGGIYADKSPPVGTFIDCSAVRDFVRDVVSFKVRDTGDTFSEFCCEVELGHGRVAANEKNVLLRGSVLRNTDAALCLVVAIGSETKQCRSVARARKGKSLFEKKMDGILLIIALIYAAMLLSTTAVGAYSVCTNGSIIYINKGPRVWQVIRLLFSNYILYSYLIPLSLYVMIEVSRFFHALYIRYDRSLKADGVKSVCRNSNVIEDLGTIDYVLTDKTGTITKNEMTLRALHVRGGARLSKVSECLSGGRADGIADCDRSSTPAPRMNTSSTASTSPASFSEDSLFLLVVNLLVCNSVEVLNGHYEGVSQDELCFLEGLKEYGYVLLERSEHAVTLGIRDRRVTVDVLHTVEFTSKRQCMATLVRFRGRPLLLVKGSDQRLLDPKKDARLLALFNGAADYRSLVMTAKALEEAEASAVVEGGEGARKLVDRHIAGASYCGATFIEDELQDDVSGTMSDLRAAGIKVWMVTGDKKETALSCARSSGIVGGEGVFVEMEGREVVSVLEKEASRGRAMPISAGSVISTGSASDSTQALGSTQALESSSRSSVNESINRMLHARNKNRTNPDLCESSTHAEPGNLFDCDGVVIYRTTPSQKGRIAELMAQAGRSVLAVGDGNNDVAMLKDAHVGVGIIGREGTQAALAADFAIPKFRLLRNLILVHGRYNLIRYSKVAINAYYKNLVFISMQYFYNFYNGASGRSIYNNFFMNYYNLFFTSLIPFSIALFDRDMPPEDILRAPQDYKTARRYFSRRVVWANLLFAVLEGAAIFFTLRAFVYLDISGSPGRLGGYSCVSTLFSTVVFFTVILRQVKIISYAVSYTYAAIALSIFFNFVVLFGVQEIGNEGSAVIYHILGMPVVYFAAAGICGAVYTIDCVFEWIVSRLMLK